MGHHGSTLTQVSNPTSTILYKVEHCSCWCSLEGVPSTIRRHQVFDIPTLKVEVTEHQIEVKVCPVCGKKTELLFPETVQAPAQYGNNITALASYMMNYQLIPFNRAFVFFRDVFNLPVSEGWLGSTRKRFSLILEKPVERIKELLKGSEVLHFDETGISHNGNREWLHVVSSKKATYYDSHPKRGTQAMNAIGGPITNMTVIMPNVMHIFSESSNFYTKKMGKSGLKGCQKSFFWLRPTKKKPSFPANPNLREIFSTRSSSNTMKY